MDYFTNQRLIVFMKKNNYFKLYGNVIPVDGYSESLICDLEKNTFLPVANQLFNLIELTERNFSIQDINKIYKNKNNKAIELFFEYIHNKGYGFYTNEPELFPKIQLNWFSPYELTNSIIEIKKESTTHIRTAVEKISSIGCEAIELRFLDCLNMITINEICNLVTQGKIKCIFLFIKYNKLYSHDEICSLYSKFHAICSVTVHSSPLIDIKDINTSLFLSKRIKYTTKQLEPIIAGIEKVIPIRVLNMSSFTEAINYNMGLNRKLCINHKGLIKNYLSHSKDYGSIKTADLQEIIKDKSFTYYWNITKDKTEICKDCQYRYMCMDNSDIITSRNKHNRINACNFSPY